MSFGAGAGRVHLTMAVNDYDHVRDFASGVVTADGLSVTCLNLPVEEIFFRFTRFREWEISELSLAKYCSLRDADEPTVTAIPVFPSRSFRHSAIYVRDDGPVDRPSDLSGMRIGIPEWTITALVYARALLQHQYGVDLGGIRWVQGGVNDPGRIETLPVALAPSIRIEAERERSLNSMLIAGDLDAIIAPHPPIGFGDDSGRIVRLFTDCAAEEEAYYVRTGIFPIMHVVAIRADVHERYPWAAMSLFKALQEAKQRSVERALDVNASRYPVPLGAATAARAAQVFGPDLWPYGVEPNLTTLEAFLQFAAEQGICSEALTVGKLFAPEVLESFKV